MIINNNINDYSLIDIESMSIFESIDVRSVTSKPEFPSEEFGNFMELEIYPMHAVATFLNFQKRFVAMT